MSRKRCRLRSDGAGLSGEIRITTGLLISGAAVLAVPDPGFVSLLVRRIKEAVFLRLKWPLGNAAAVVWYGLGMRYLARRAEWNPVLACCLIAGLLGPLTRV